MSLFRPYNYKDRPDIDPDAPQKHGFFVFWEIYARKFWRFVSLNLIYFAFTFPLLILFYLTANGYMAQIAVNEFEDLLPGLSIFASVIQYIPSSLYLPLVILSILCYGPITMGVTYVLRNFAREEHAWISDVFLQAWKNVKQGLFFGLLDVVIIILLVSNITRQISPEDTYTTLRFVIRYASWAILVFYLFMRHYTYMIAVTFDLKISAILKNARIFIILGFFRNIWALLACLIIWVAALLTSAIITMVSVPFLVYSLTGFVVVFVCYPVIKRYMIDPQMKEDGVEGLDELLQSGGGEKPPERHEKRKDEEEQ